MGGAPWGGSGRPCCGEPPPRMSYTAARAAHAVAPTPTRTLLPRRFRRTCWRLWSAVQTPPTLRARLMSRGRWPAPLQPPPCRRRPWWGRCARSRWTCSPLPPLQTTRMSNLRGTPFFRTCWSRCVMNWLLAGCDVSVGGSRNPPANPPPRSSAGPAPSCGEPRNRCTLHARPHSVHFATFRRSLPGGRRLRCPGPPLA